PGEVPQRPGQRSGQDVVAEAGDDPEQPGQEAAGERSDQRDQELVSRAAGFHPGPGGPAEQEQGDVLDPDPPGLGDQGVGQLMDQDRAEEQHRRQDAQPDRPAAGQLRVQDREPQVHAVGDEQGDHRPGGVDANLDAGNPAYPPG